MLDKDFKLSKLMSDTDYIIYLARLFLIKFSTGWGDTNNNGKVKMDDKHCSNAPKKYYLYYYGKMINIIVIPKKLLVLLW